MSIKSGGSGSLSGIGSSGAVQQMLFKLTGANMQLTSDQPFSRLFSGTNYFITSVVAKRISGAVALLTAGGIYTGASKAGDALVLAAQVWTALTGANTLQTAALAALVLTNLETATPILSLTTGSSTAATADIFIFGSVID